MRFEIGKYYQFSSNGGKIHVLGELKTTAWGKSLIAESDSGSLYCVGRDEASAVNWHEIDENEWMKSFSN